MSSVVCRTRPTTHSVVGHGTEVGQSSTLEDKGDSSLNV